MNLMGYDAMALGPQELTLGLEALRQRMDEARFPMLSANVVLTGTKELVAAPYAILEVGEHRLGVIGLTRVPAEGAVLAGSLSQPDLSESTLGLPSPMGFQVLDPQEAAARYVPEVAEKADTVVVLTNVRYRAGLGLAEAVPGIDLLIAALPGQLPDKARRAPGTGALVITAEQPLPRHAGRRVGRLEVTLGGDGSLSGESWVSVAMDKQIADDFVMGALLEQARR